MFRRKLAAFLLMMLLLAGLAAPAVAGGHTSFLWQVKSRTNTVYVLGSIHLAKPDLYPLNPRIETAFGRSELLAVEADVTKLDPNQVQQLIQKTGLYPEGQTLEGHVSDKTKARMKAMGFDPAAFGQLRPWLAAIMLQAQQLQSLGFNEKYGVDRHFLKKAGLKNMPVAELESIDYQFRLLGSLSKDEQEMFLSATLAEFKNMESLIGQMIQAWRVGDTGRFDALFFKQYHQHPEYKPLVKKIIVERNEKMRAKIEGFLQNKETCFVIVGAGHLTGAWGIIQGLKDKGYTVKQQ